MTNYTLNPATDYTEAVAYYRVSTQKQGTSGLGLDAQKSSVSSYAHYANLDITQEFTEIETGKGSRANKRVEIHKAIQAAKEKGAVLLIAKLDRLARNVHFVSSLMDSGIDFIAVDMPEANRLTIHIMAAMAEHEARAISERTKAALAVAKARGVQLGLHPNSRNLDNSARAKGKATNISKAKEAYKAMSGYVKMLRDTVDENGKKMAWAKVAERLNSEGLRTRQGKEFKPMTVKRIYDRLQVQ